MFHGVTSQKMRCNSNWTALYNTYYFPFGYLTRLVPWNTALGPRMGSNPVEGSIPSRCGYLHPRYRKDYLRAGALFDSPSLPPPKQSLILSQFSANQSYPALSGLLCAYFLLVWQSCLFGAGSALPRNAHRLTWRRESEEDKRKSGDLSWASMLVITTPPK